MIPPPRPKSPPEPRVAVACVWLALSFAVLAVDLHVVPLGDADLPRDGRPLNPLPPAVAGVVGLLAPWAYWSRYRAFGLVPVGAAAMLLGTVWSWAAGAWDGWHWALAGGGVGLVFGGANRALVRTAGVRAVAVEVAGGCVVFALGLTYVSLARHGRSWVEYERLTAAVLVGLSLLLSAVSVVGLFRPLFELSLEPVVWLSYRIRGRGPGLTAIPSDGPCLVVANHACWLDPLFLAKVLPRPITPIMTARFFNVWFLKPLLKHVFRVIVVPENAIKRETPEIDEAIAALDRGACVVIFPEGYLRRKEEQPLRRFGRGVWEILRARPDTPVVTCWIEGGWGSYCSYYNGKPTQNKRPDVRRPIGVGASAPVVVDAATLAHHLDTRLGLMNRVADARKHIGLGELPPYVLPSRDEAEAGEAGA